MDPLPPLPPGLDPFAGLGSLGPLLDPLVRLLRLPLRLVYSALTLAAAVNANGPAAMAAAGASLGPLIELLFVILLVVAIVAVVLVILVTFGVGAMLAAVVTAFATRRRPRPSR